MNSRGVSGMYSILLSLIIGLMVMSIALFFIFNEGIFGDGGEMEVCRQSVQLRATLPEAEILGMSIDFFREDFPLKCKTGVKVIEKKDIAENDAKEAKKIIGETMAECWYLFDKGDSSAFPSKWFVGSTCVPCARIHLSEEAKAYMIEKDIKFNIRAALDEPMDKDFTFYTYLRNSGKKFPAFDLAFSGEFYFNGTDFSVMKEDYPGRFKSKTGGIDEPRITIDIFGIINWSSVEVHRVSLPKFFDPKKGDLLINYGIITASEDSGIGNYIPYLFYFQAGQESNPFIEAKKDLVDGEVWNNAKVCESWEGIPG